MGWEESYITAVMDGGWDTLTGGTMSTRISLSHLGLGREAMYQLHGRELIASILEEAAGPIGSIVMSPILMVEDIHNGHTMRGIEKIMPKVARDLMKATRFSQEGATTYAGETIVTAEEFTKWDIFLQAIGLTPSKLNNQYEQNKALRNEDRALGERHQWLLNSYWQAFQLGDMADKKEARQAINRWNLKQPQWRIDTDAMKASYKSKERMALQTYKGLALTPRLDNQIRKDLTWYTGNKTKEQLPKPSKH